MRLDTGKARQALAAIFCVLTGTLSVGYPTLATATAADLAQPTQSAILFADFILPNGAITVFPKGDYVEPYFALKALLAAHRLGVDVTDATSSFAHWLLPFQQANGPFPRICRSGANDWVACGPADADDSLDALWCLLAAEVLSRDKVLAASCARSLDHLSTLWHPAQQTFHALSGRSAAYFADNVEVIGALNYLRRDRSAAARFAVQLAALPSSASMLQGLQRNYGYDPDGALEPQRASVPPTPYGFYPNAVAPVYLWLYGLRAGTGGERYWHVWMERYSQKWLAGESDHFPWGLIAWAAYQTGDLATARTWLENSDAWRAGGRWNVVEEGVRIGLTNVLRPAPNSPPPSLKSKEMKPPP
ncbi:hypothetical protein SAMN04515620_13044 [Collimonas sp. OK607]|uniref:hypothetical protein n=1 Tax=Collimonas sp. OK607 TaxID=1798194 RepID=UPI0008E1C8F4|nr:hypothetical protein [Collimonas sp. OK607]SFB24977.1 hypothetical protein SAMN04515620_13044 [Collimonas sp. OK607]